MKNNNIFRKLLLCTLTLSLMFAMFGCGRIGLPQGFSDAEVKEIAVDAVEDIAEGDYRDVAEEFSKEMKALFGEEGLREAIEPQMKELGRLKGITNVTVSGKEDSYAGDYATVTVECEFENGSSSFVISVDRNENICELYMK